MKTCNRCHKKQATVDFTYTKQSVCSSCFKRIIERRITKTVRENKLIEKGDKIGIAISGGKDSRALLEFVKRLTKGRKVELIAIHVFRGDRFAAKSLLACETMCREVGVPLQVVSFQKDLGITFADIVNITKKCGSNRCTVCGVMRRRVLNNTAKNLKCTKLATGHNLTDEAQTYLMNFIRGDITTFSHLGPISLPRQKELIQRIKPLRDVPEEDVKKYVNIKGWSYFPEPCPCRVGSLRFNMLDIMDLLRKARPGVEFSIVKSGDWIRKQSTKKAVKFNECAECGEPCSGKLCKVCELLKLK